MNSQLRVRYQETDQMGIVYHANYLIWFEVGRTNLLRELGYSYRELEEIGIILPVVEVNAKYHHSAKYDEEISIETTLQELGPSKIVFQYKVTRKADGQLLATGNTKHIWVSKEMKFVQLRKRCPELYDQLTKMLPST